jgi:hypothetical protein
MEIGVANGGSIRKERERSFGGAALFGGEVLVEVLSASEPVFELLALGGEFRGGGELMDLRVEISKEACGVEEFPGLALDELEEGGAFDTFENNSDAAIDIDQVIGGGDRTTDDMERASDLKFEFGFGGRESSEEKFENASLFPGENLGGESFADQFTME